MRVLLAANDKNPHLRRIETVASLINGCQKFFRLDLTTAPDLPTTGKPISPAALSAQIETIWNGQYVIFITEGPFKDNWFSHE